MVEGSGEAFVRISADTSNFEWSFAHTLDVLTVYALRELAFVMMMEDSAGVAFENPDRFDRIRSITDLTPEQLHKAANDIMEEMSKRPDQASLPKEEQ